MVDAVGRSAAVLAPTIVPGEDGAAGQRNRPVARCLHIAPETYHRWHHELARRGSHRLGTRLDQVDPIADHQHHGPASRHNGQRLIGGVEHERPHDRQAYPAILDTLGGQSETRRMRVAAYVRELPSSSAFAQSEQVRRWATHEGHHLLATFQDVRGPGGESTHGGLRALIGLTEAGGVDAVVVATLEAFSLDVIIQEVIMEDLRRRDVQVVSVAESDVRALAEPPADAARLFIRDVLARRQAYEDLGGAHSEPAEDVLIELIKSA